MQDFRDNEKKKNGRLAAILDFISAKFVMGDLCERHYILFYIHGPGTVEHRYNTNRYNTDRL